MCPAMKKLAILGGLFFLACTVEAPSPAFEKARELSPDDPAFANRLALALALDGQLDRSEAEYREALALDPMVGELPDNVFRVLRTMGREDLSTGLRQRLAQ